MDIDHNVAELCRNNKNIKVLGFNYMVITEDSFRAIAENGKKMDGLTITFLKSNQATYER